MLSIYLCDQGAAEENKSQQKPEARYINMPAANTNNCTIDHVICELT